MPSRHCAHSKFRSALFALALPAFTLACPELLSAAEAGKVSADLVREFTGGIISESLPAGFPVVTLPDGVNVRVLGSLDMGGVVQQVLLDSTQGVDALREALRKAYVAAGWTDLTPTPMLVRLCHDSLGSLQITTSAQSGTQRLRVLRTSGISTVDPNLPCRELQGSQQNGGLPTYILGWMPVLAVPPQTVRPPRGIAVRPFVSMSSSSSSSGTSVEMEHDGLIEVPDINIAGLYAHFAARLDEQGWRKDSEGAGTRSATAVWYKTAAPPAYAPAGTADTELTGTMTILHTTANQYRVQFKLQAALPGQTTPGSTTSVRDIVPYDVLGNGATLGIRGIPTGYTAGSIGVFQPF